MFWSKQPLRTSRATVWAARLVIGLVLMVTAGCGQAEPRAKRNWDEGVKPASKFATGANMSLIEIVSGTEKWTAGIENSPAGRDFLMLLPLELTLSDYSGNEKIADLPRPLSSEGEPAAVTPKSGDIAFYAPWGNLAIFYRDGHHSPGLIILGRLDDPAPFARQQTMMVSIRRLAVSSR